MQYSNNNFKTCIGIICEVTSSKHQDEKYIQGFIGIFATKEFIDLDIKLYAGNG